MEIKDIYWSERSSFLAFICKHHSFVEILSVLDDFGGLVYFWQGIFLAIFVGNTQN